MVFSCSTSYLCAQIQALEHPRARTSLLTNSVNAMIVKLEASLGRELCKREQQDSQSAFYIMDKRTNGLKLPREFQMRATLEILSGKNIVVRAGTGAGKTIAMALPMLLRPEWTFVTITPLMALQNQHVETFTNLGVKTVALNKETPPAERPRLLREVKKGLYQHIVISPEQCGRSGSEPPMFTRLLEDPAFCARIKCINYDEAHFIVTAGEPDKQGNVFRPEYAKGSEILIRLSLGTPCSLYSATMPPKVLDQIMKSLRLPTSTTRTSYISLTTNRPNLSFAVKKAAHPLCDLSNFDCIFPSAYHPPMARFKKTLIFVNSMDMANALMKRFNRRLPGFAQRIYSALSSDFKAQLINEFTNSSGINPVLITTTVLSNGFNPQDVELVIIYGAPANMIEFEQMAGRGGRDGKTSCLVLLIAENWLFSPDKRNTTNLCAKGLRTDDKVFDFAQVEECRREFLAKMNNDTTSEALKYSGPLCCDSEHHAVSVGFSIDFWLPVYRFCDTGNQDSAVALNSEQTSRAVYRPIPERGPLEDLIKAWRSKVHSDDPLSSIFPLGDILPSKSISLVARLRSDAPELASDDTLTSFLQQNSKWRGIYAQDLHRIIRDYDASLPAKPVRKVKNNEDTPARTCNRFIDTPAASFCGVLAFDSGPSCLQSQAQAHSNTPDAMFSGVIDFNSYLNSGLQSQSQAHFHPPAAIHSGVIDLTSGPSTVQSQSQAHSQNQRQGRFNKRIAPVSSQASRSSKRIKREVLGDLPVKLN